MPIRNAGNGTDKFLSFYEGLDNTSSLDGPDIKYTLSVALNTDLVDDSLMKKRNGYTKVNTSAWGTRRIREGLEYKKNATSVESLVYGEDSTTTTVSGILAKLNGTGAPTTIKSSLRDGLKPSIVQFRDLIYCFNGYDDFLYNGATTRQIGITAPTTAPTFVANSSGDLTVSSSYLFVYTYYQTATGAESSPSDPSEAITNGADTATAGVQITVVAGDSTTADKIRVYRTFAGGSTFFLDDEIAITSTSFNSTNADTSLSTQLELDNERLPEKAKYATVVDNRIFTAGFASNPNRVQYSKVGLSGPMPESFQAADIADCNINGGDVIIGLGQVNSQVIVLKERSVGRLVRVDASFGGLETSGSQKYIYEEISSEVTGVNHHTIVSLDSIVLWMGRNEIYGTDGSQIFRFGSRIFNTLKTLNYIQSYKFSAINKSDTKQVIFSVVRDGQLEPDFQLVGHYRRFPKIAWTFYSPGTNSTTHPGLTAASMFRVTENQLNVVYFGSSAADGTIYKMDTGSNDNSLGIYWDVRLPWYSAQNAAALKLFHSLYTFAAGNGNSTYSVTQTFEADNSEVIITSQTAQLEGGSNSNWATPNWAAFTWATLRYSPLKFFPFQRAYFGRFGFNNTSADQPVVIKGITSIVQIDPIH